MDSATAHFPWRAANQVQLLQDAREFYPAMLEAINGAQELILLEMYLVQPGQVLDRFMEALCAAAQRRVAIHLLLDDFGTRTLSNKIKKDLTTAGIRLCFFNPLRVFKFRLNLIRDHRKLLVVDSKLAFVGGAGIADSIEQPVASAWRENMLRIEGTCAADWCQLFTDNWNLWSDAWLSLSATASEQKPNATNSATSNIKGRVVAGHYFSAREIKRIALKHIRNAQTRVWISSAYFLPPLKLHSALRRAARNGIDVRILVPGPVTDHPAIRVASHRFYTRMLHHGVRIFEYQPRFMHAKTLLCDNLVSIGSCNFDRWSLRWNLEANQEFLDPAFAAEVETMFLRDLEDSQEITLPEWLSRSPWLRFQESLIGLIEAWILRRSYRVQLKLEAKKRLEKLYN